MIGPPTSNSAIWPIATIRLWAADRAAGLSACTDETSSGPCSGSDIDHRPGGKAAEARRPAPLLGEHASYRIEVQHHGQAARDGAIGGGGRRRAVPPVGDDDADFVGLAVSPVASLRTSGGWLQAWAKAGW